MQKNRAIQQKLLRLILLPSAIAVLLLAAAYYALHSEFLNNHKHQRDLFIHSLFADFTGSRHVEPHLLDHLSLALLSMEGFRTLAVEDADQRTLWSRGLPISPLPADVLQKVLNASRQGHSYCFSGRCYSYISTGIELTSENSKDPMVTGAKFIVVVTDNLQLQIATYQSMLALLAIVGLCLTLAMIYIRRFREAILEPLEKLHLGIQEYIRGHYDRVIPSSKNNVYNPLIQDINQLALLQKNAQENLQQNIEQSTQELRETLETVEIQNIELDIARKSALQASRVKSEFLANTSHEIRTPLNGILGFSELLKKTEMTPQQTEYLETIDESAKGLLTIINDILDFSRLEIGKLTLEYKPVRLRQVIEDSLRLQAPSGHEKKLRLLTVVDHDIPEHLLGDPLRLQQVLSNLLSNAIKFTETGHILISVSKEDRADNQITLQFRITDSGIGLNQDQQERLFDAFTQLDSSESRAYGGTGLGLAIAKGLVDRMNGQIGVESEPGKGATFWFTSTLGRNPKAVSSSGYLTGTLRNIRAVIYDCSSMSRTEITHYIRGWGAEVHEISRFEDIEAKTEEACRTGQIHLAILDAQINDKSFDKLRLKDIIDVLNQDYSIPVIVLASPAIQRLIEPSLVGTHSIIFPRPLFCNRLHQVVCEQLGIIIPDTDSETQPPATKKTEDSSGVHILAVDDNPANLRLVTELLKDLDVQVLAVDNGADALRECESREFDLILMDIQMPGMDGLEATRELRKRENPDNRTPVVALTAHAVNEQKSKLLLAGMDDYLTKPVSENELSHIIDRWVARNPRKRPLRKSVDLAPSIAAAHTAAEPVDIPEDERVDMREPLINLQQSLSLAKNKPALARDMMKMLLDSMGQTYLQIQTYLNEGNIKDLQETIHKLHGGSCYCGVPRLKKASAELDGRMQSALQRNEAPARLEESIAMLLSIMEEMMEWYDTVDLDILFEEDDNAA